MSLSHARAAALAALSLAVPAGMAAQVTPVAGDPLTGSGSVSRTLLTYSTLNNSSTSANPVNDSAYAVPTGAAAPTDTFQGTLTLTSPLSVGSYSTSYNPDNYSATGWKHLPATFSVQFVQNGSWLIPVNQGWQVTGSSYWNYIVGPGRAWTESTDNGYTRASFPFALVEYNQNCVHQGEMTFLFSNTKSPAISYVNYQVTMHSCEYWHFDMWGTIAATYTQSTIANATALENAEAAEIANRIPVKPFSSLATDFPNSGFTASNFTSEFSYPSDIATYGVYINGTNYVAGCTTYNGVSVLGTYAFCAEMRFPSYSVAKTAFANMALSKLGQDYGSGVYSQLIKTWLPTYYTQGGTWTSVTFDNTSDMATGNYTSSGYEVDEDSTIETNDVIDIVPYTTKIGNSFKYFPSTSTTPGTLWVYHTHDSFILTAAMQNYLQAQTTNSNDLQTYLSTNIYTPLKLSAGGQSIMRTDNAASATSTTGYPLGGYGMFFNQDDILKIANFMNTGTGIINSAQVIDASRLQDTQFRSSNPGLIIPDSGFYSGTPPVANTNHYNNEVWEKTYTPTEYSALSCSFNATYMSGYGGNTVTMFPNGAIYYMFSDGGEFFQDNAMLEINKLIPMCPGSSATLNATQLSFSSTTVAPVTQTLTLTNPNAYAIALSVPTVSGPNASLFSVGNVCPTLAANASCTLNVTFTPTATGNSSATLTVPTSNSYVIGTTVTANTSTALPLLGYVGSPRTTPTISWATPGAITYGTALSGTQLNATTTVPGSFAYLPASGTVLAAGFQTLNTTFTPSDTTTYAETSYSVGLQVNQVPTSISWTPSAHAVFQGAALGTGILNASSTTAGSIAYTATPTGGSATTVTSATVLGVGTYTLTATLTPTNSNYASSKATQSLTVLVQNVWAANSGGSVSGISAAGSTITSSATTGGGLGIAIDSAGNLWSLTPNGGAVAKFSNAGTLVNAGYSGGGLSAATSLAIDGNGLIWLANGNNSITALTNSGAAVTPSTGYTDSTLSSPSAIAIDNAGNVWVLNGNNSVDEIIGVAAPVAPLVVGVQNSTLGTKP